MSSTIEKLLAEQSKIGQRIQAIITNFKKDSPSRKDKVEYFETRKQQLHDAWSNFEDADNEIRSLKEIPLDNEYFTNDFYGKIQQLYEQYSKIFEEGIMSLKKRVDRGASPLLTATMDVPVISRQNEDNVSNNSRIEAMMRRQEAISASLRRLIAGMKKTEDLSPTYKEVQLKSINKLWDEIENLNYTICEQCTDPRGIGYDMEAYIALEETIRHHRISLETPKLVPVAEQFNRIESSIQLPKITIPKFDGDYLKWQQFNDIYTKMIHEQQMSSVQKMWYLKSNISGEAERLIRHLPLSDENYASAWKIMNERYSNKRVLATALIQKILDQATIAPEATSVKNFHDSVQESLLALNNIGIQTKDWDPLLLHILVKRLDRQTHVLYEQSLKDPRELQTIDDFLSFLQNRFHSLEAVGRKDKLHNTKTVSSVIKDHNNVKISKCGCCNSDHHPLYYCDKFIKMSVPDRLKWIQKQGLCVNCLRPGHKSKACSSRNCNKCSQKHNTLLHLENNKSKISKTESPTLPTAVVNSNETTQSMTLAASNNDFSKQKYVVLATAKILVTANNGQTSTFKAVLDSGSQINLVSERLIRQLGVKPLSGSISIEGIGKNIKNSKHRVNLTMKSLSKKFSSRFEAFVLPEIVSPQPTQTLDTSGWNIPENIALADVKFSEKSKIDVLLGAEFYYDLLLPGQIKLGKHLPILQNSMFGWLVCGKVNSDVNNSVTCAIHGESFVTIDELVERFWKLDDLNDSCNNFTAAERHCEQHFNQNVRRDSSGKFIVRLPFSDNPSNLGDSKSMALSRFLALEKRLTRDQALKADYVRFMHEYESLNHMEEIQPNDIPKSHYFIPHHCILRPEKSTTRLRVVFDASAKTSTGLSLNNILYSGPVVQSDLFSILLRFRTPRYVFTTDIEKMYRQVIIDSQDQAYQLILWRGDPAEKLKYYRLQTVTYGTTSAPYLATKCLQYLAMQHSASHPLGAQALRDDFYVDDGLCGSDNLTTAIDMQIQLISLLKSAGFKPHKWCANHPRLLQGIPREELEVDLDFDHDDKSSIKTLGLTWIPKADAFCIKVQVSDITTITKRAVLSNLAQIFDPLGILGPVVVTAKLFIQQLWKMKLSWDEEIPKELQRFWDSFRSNLLRLNQQQIPRHVLDAQMPSTIQIHIFADASEKAYGAVAYLRSTYTNKVLVRLLCSKSRVAPLKTQTLPRLELCAALLGAELAARVYKDLRLKNATVFLWTDSEIVLQWINSTASSFHTFVANRVSKIQQLSTVSQWNHVRSHHNPADLLSRGLTPEKLLSCTLWLYGPLFLHGSDSIMPQPFSKALLIENDLEKRQKKIALTITTSTGLEEFIYKINHKNSFKFLVRVVAFVLRFINKLKCKSNRSSQTALEQEELHNAWLIIVKTIQTSDFSEDLAHLKKHKAVPNGSPLSTLSSYIDDLGILRVGGRLEASELSYDAKHPVILPYNDSIAKLIFKQIHEDNMHCGPQTLLSLVRMQYWPIKGKITARNIVHNCVRCTRARPKLMNQVMGNLPKDRITPAKPFLNTGVDYWGPLWVHYKIRGKRPHKVYVAVFCCFATKAVHLEVVSDLTTEAFIAALKRFISRRGRCKTLYCDNATNFVGANNQLLELNTVIYSDVAKNTIIDTCSQRGIDFKFIPPRAPHFGGLWEAAVKSAKHLLLKNISTASLTYEELETVIVETEAILNSRPLTPISSDPSDLTALTPGHFLIGEPLVAQADANLKDQKTTLTRRWKLITQLKQEFWTRWVREYLQELQQRHKWRQQFENVKEGTMVIIKEDNLPPLQWPLGRILKTYKGDDGVIRVVDVRTKSGVWKRPIHRLAPLPIETQSSESNIESSHLEPLPSKRPKLSMSSPVILILSLIFLPLILTQSINVTRFDNNPGLYFENIGTTSLITAEWKLIVYYDLTPIRKEINILINGTDTLQYLCNQLPLDTHCSSLVNHYLYVTSDLQLDNTFLQKERKKRAALDIIGNIANKLFGVLDSDYAKDMSKTINRIKNNEIQINEVLKRHTSVIDSTINIIKQNQEDTNSRLNQLNKRTKEILNAVNHEGRQAKIFQNFISLTLQMSTIIAELQRVQTTILNVLTDTHHGKISPLLLSPSQLRQEAVNIKNQLSPSQQLPVQEDDILHLYRLMTSQAGITDHHVIFVIKLPLIDQERFDLFRIIPIPIQYNNTVVLIQTDSQILATNSHRDQYFPLSLAEFKTCLSIKESTYMCVDKQSKFNRGSTFLSCEISLLNNGTSKDCKVTRQFNEFLWIQLYHKNQWIYATQNPIEMTAVCDASISQLKLNKSGMISIQPNCIIRNGLITIRGHPVVNSTVHTSYATFGNLTTIVNFADINKTFETSTSNVYKQLEELTTLQKMLKSKDIINVADQLQFHNTHHYAVSYSALLISISIMCGLIWIIIKYYKRSKIPPQKPKRVRTSPAFIIQEELKT